MARLVSFKMEKEKLAQHQPTQYPTSEELSIGKIMFKAFDLGGHRMARRVWKDYYAEVDAVVYLVDAYDKERFAESKMELDALLSDGSLAGVPFLILAFYSYKTETIRKIGTPSRKTFIAGFLALFLDSTLHRKDNKTRKDRGMHWWDRFRSFKIDTRSEEFYSLPFNLNKFFPSV